MDITLPLKQRSANILLIEDDAQDVILTRKCFKNSGFAVNLFHACNGEEGLAFLRQEGEFADKPQPDLILLDLNMPVMNGHEVLDEITRDDNLRHMPVVVLTTSEDERDVQAMYALRCNTYITKPVDFKEFHKIIEHLCWYWFAVATLPGKAGSNKL